jgi:molybdopterin-guanine dinucleotide biosynthesis protein A
MRVERWLPLGPVLYRLLQVEYAGVMIEAAILTGGKSRRMGVDKAKLLVDGEPQAERIVRLLTQLGVPVTTLGREPTAGAGFLPDPEEFAGPISALRRFRPAAEMVFVASCDLPRFDNRLVDLLASKIGDKQAAVPLIDGWKQPLCALYQASAFAALQELDGQCAMSWLDRLQVVLVTEQDFAEAGLSSNVTRGANTPEELEQVLRG